MSNRLFAQSVSFVLAAVVTLSVMVGLDMLASAENSAGQMTQTASTSAHS